jgi:hypothetical protein
MKTPSDRFKKQINLKAIELSTNFQIRRQLNFQIPSIENLHRACAGRYGTACEQRG